MNRFNAKDGYAIEFGKKIWLPLGIIFFLAVTIFTLRHLSKENAKITLSKPDDSMIYLRQINELNAKCRGESFVKMELVGDKFSITSACTTYRGAQ